MVTTTTADQREDEAMSNYQSTVDVIDGTVRVTVPGSEDTDLAVVDGRTVPTEATVEPWGETEYHLDRADDALGGMGWVRVGAWEDSIPYPTCRVTLVKT
jgi:hypothetical protein